MKVAPRYDVREARAREMGVWSFLRHGQSVANAGGWLAGTQDSALTEVGEQQALAAREAVLATSFSRAFTSDLQRARRTAEIVLEGGAVPLKITPLLRERGCGEWEGRLIEDPLDNIDVFATWHLRPPGGESLRDVSLRALAWLAEVDDGTDTLIVAHGALIRSVLGVFDGLTWDEIPFLRPTNCQLFSREAPRGHWQTLYRVVKNSPA